MATTACRPHPGQQAVRRGSSIVRIVRLGATLAAMVAMALETMATPKIQTVARLAGAAVLEATLGQVEKGATAATAAL